MARQSRSKRKKNKVAQPAAPAARAPRPRRGQGPPAAVGMPPVDGTPLVWWFVAAALIAAAVIGVYWNTLDNEFVTFDDRKYIYENQFVVGDTGLGAIWLDVFNARPRLHYYPMTFSTFWVEYQLVGPFPAQADVEGAMGQPAHPLFHVTQMLLHAINACLILLVLRILGIRFPTAVFTAAFFALHPVNVASVAWVAERKNLVSALFLWTALLLYVHHRRLAEHSIAYARGKFQGWYLGAVLAFAFALSAKAAVLVGAPVILITDRLLDRRWSMEAVWRSVPFFALGGLMAMITSAREAFIAKSWTPVELWARPFIAASALVHYVQKMLLPVKQALIYPRWEISLLNPRYWISLALVAVAAWLIWRYRKWLGDAWLWGLGLFLLTVAPVLGLKHFIWTDFAFASDHYMYYGSTGVILMVALLIERWCRGKESGWRRERVAVIAALSLVALAGCGWRVTQQCATWQDNKALWTHTISVAPDTMIARMNLGNHYTRHGQNELALEQYTEWTRIRPDFARAWRDRARSCWRLQRHDEAVGDFRRAVSVAESKNPDAWSIRKELADYLRTLQRWPEALTEYEALMKKTSVPEADAAEIERRAADVRQRLATWEPPVSPVEP